MDIKHKILIVDDSSDDQLILKLQLGNRFDIVAVESSDEAVAAMQGSIFSAAMVDINLGKESGFNVGRELQDADPNMAVILMTGAVRNYRNANPGFDDYIVKVNERADLAGNVRSAIHKKGMPREIRLRRLKLLHGVAPCKGMLANVYRRVISDENGEVEKLVGKLKQDGRFLTWNVYQLLQHKDIFTVSLASSIGCIGGCKFCLHGREPWVRYLEPEEMISQAIHGLDSILAQGVFELAKPLKPCINLTGMGEPLKNWKNLKIAIRRLVKAEGLDFQFIITTLGLEKDLKTLLGELDSLDMDLSRLRIYMSLNFPDSGVRSDLMPATKGQNLLACRDLLLKIWEKTGNKPTASAMIIPGKNDRDKDIKVLAEEWGMLLIKLQAFAASPKFAPYPTAKPEHLEAIKANLEQAGAKYVRTRTVVGGWQNGGCGSDIADQELYSDDCK